MLLRFDTNITRNLGIIFKEPEGAKQGLNVTITISLDRVSSIKVNYLVNGSIFTDTAKVVDYHHNVINIPFKMQTYPIGRHEFSVTLMLNDGTVKTSQSCIYRVINPILEGQDLDLVPMTYVNSLQKDFNSKLCDIENTLTADVNSINEGIDLHNDIICSACNLITNMTEVLYELAYKIYELETIISIKEDEAQTIPLEDEVVEDLDKYQDDWISK